jgi:hypothetical protein
VWNDSKAAKLTSFAARLAREVHECFVFPESGGERHNSMLRFVQQVLETLADGSCGEDHGCGL